MAQALDLASRLGLLPFEIARLAPTANGSDEFFLAMRRLPAAMSSEDQRAAFAASLAGLDLAEEFDPCAIDIETLRRQASAAEARAAAIEGSTIWRLTAPLRRMIDFARWR